MEDLSHLDSLCACLRTGSRQEAEKAQQELSQFLDDPPSFDIIDSLFTNEYSEYLKCIGCDAFKRYIQNQWLFIDDSEKLQQVDSLLQYIQSHSSVEIIFKRLQSVLSFVAQYDCFKTYTSFFEDLFSGKEILFYALSCFAQSLTGDSGQSHSRDEYTVLKGQLISHFSFLLPIIFKNCSLLDAANCLEEMVPFLDYKILMDCGFRGIIDTMEPLQFPAVCSCLTVAGFDDELLKHALVTLSEIAEDVGDYVMDIAPILQKHFALFESDETINVMNKFHDIIIRYGLSENPSFIYWDFFALTLHKDEERKKKHSQTLQLLFEMLVDNMVIPFNFDDDDFDYNPSLYDQQTILLTSLYTLNENPAKDFVFNQLNQLVANFDPDIFNSVLWVILKMRKTKFSNDIITKIMQFFNAAMVKYKKNFDLIKGFLMIICDIMSNGRLPSELADYTLNLALAMIPNHRLQHYCAKTVLMLKNTSKLKNLIEKFLSAKKLRTDTYQMLCEACVFRSYQIAVKAIIERYKDIDKLEFIPANYTTLAFYCAALEGIGSQKGEFIPQILETTGEKLISCYRQACELFAKGDTTNSLVDYIKRFILVSRFADVKYLDVIVAHFKSLPDTLYPDFFQTVNSFISPSLDTAKFESVHMEIDPIFITPESRSQKYLAPMIIKITETRSMNLLNPTDIVYLYQALKEIKEEADRSIVLRAIISMFSAAAAVFDASSFQQFLIHYYGPFFINVVLSVIKEETIDCMDDYFDVILLFAQISVSHPDLSPCFSDNFVFCVDTLHTNYPLIQNLVTIDLIKEMMNGKREIIEHIITTLYSAFHKKSVDSIFDQLTRKRFGKAVLSS